MARKIMRSARADGPPHVDLALEAARREYRQRLHAEGLEAGRAIEADRRLVAFGHGELEHADTFAALRMVDRGFDERAAGARAACRRLYVHAEQERLVARLRLGGELQRHGAHQRAALERAE